VATDSSTYQTKKILFTSLFSWTEFDLITVQNGAIAHWDGSILRTKVHKDLKVELLHMNIPFNALNKFPAPAEINAKINDINDLPLLKLVFESFQKLAIRSPRLEQLAKKIEQLPTFKESAFLEKATFSQNIIDQFRLVKKKLTSQLMTVSETPFVISLRALLTQKRPDGLPLKGIDFLIYLDFVAKELGYLHNKNSRHSTDRSAGADAADKAQYAFMKLTQKPFLPGYSSEEGVALFQVLYSMYLVWEEPELNAALSTGFVGEKFHRNFFQKNPETTRYLMEWLQNHPALYLGLSEYR